MNKKIYEKPKLHRLGGRYNSALGSCTTGSDFLCASGQGYNSQSTVNCQAGTKADTACLSGNYPEWIVCGGGFKATTTCSKGNGDQCKAGTSYGVCASGTGY